MGFKVRKENRFRIGEKMKKILTVVLTLLLSVALFATQFHSVPLGHEAYRIIETGELRGIIEQQTDVKPYNLNTVRALLKTMKESDKLSQTEKTEIDNILKEFDLQYGREDNSVTEEDGSKLGFFRTGGKTGVTTFGGNFTTTQSVGMKSDGTKIFDSRNGVTAYIKGSILGYVSYDLNFKVNIDHLDPNAFLPTELLFSCEGFYMSFLHEGADSLSELPDEHFYTGIETFPEMSTSIANDVATIRIGAVKRDWGPGVNNFALSGSARVMDGFELSLKPTSWFNYSVMSASLGQASLKTVNGVEWPSEHMDQEGKYSNNLSMHRVELGPVYGARLGIWESVVWRKRFELSYLNPLAIYMFTQNSLGDYDNVIAGLDLTYLNPKIGEFYAAFSFDELKSIKKALVHPRNIIAFQAGAKFSLPFGTFTELKIQGTYVSAFFGSHYEAAYPLFGNTPYTTAYVNKGQNIGYPLNPDSLEFLLDFDTTLSYGIKLSVEIKDQMRSAQYATKTTGTDILTYMSYEAEYAGEYYYRDFFNNIWNNIVDVEVEAQKSFDSKLPVTVTLGLQAIVNSSRTFDPERKGSNPEYNPGKINSWGDWNTTFSLCGKVGVKLGY